MLGRQQAGAAAEASPRGDVHARRITGGGWPLGRLIPVRNAVSKRQLDGRDDQRVVRGHGSSVSRYSRFCYSCGVAPRSDRSTDDPESFLPLHRDTFHVLVSLADRDRHGYAVMQDVIERTDGALRLSPSSLYASIRRLLEQGLIEELAERPDPAHDDERRRYYRLTRLGRAVATAEAKRLERLLADARATGLLARRS